MTGVTKNEHSRRKVRHSMLFQFRTEKHELNFLRCFVIEDQCCKLRNILTIFASYCRYISFFSVCIFVCDCQKFFCLSTFIFVCLSTFIFVYSSLSLFVKHLASLNRLPLIFPSNTIKQ